MKKLFARSILSASVALICAGIATQASAGAFQLLEENGSGLGDFYAGGAAIAQDASTSYYNPAGLIRLTTPQITASGVGIITNSQFTGTNTWTSTNPLVPKGFLFQQTGTANGGDSALVPAFHAALPINSRVVLGFSADAPFGLSTNWGSDSLVGYSGTQSIIQVIQFGPTIGLGITNQFSIGGGVDFNYTSADLKTLIGSPTALYPVVPFAANNSISVNKGNAWDTGWHAGVLYQFTPATRVGLSYHSKIQVTLKGRSTLTGPVAANVGSNPISSSNLVASGLSLPAFTMLSVYHDINPVWTVMGSAMYTQWDADDAINLQNVASIVAVSPVPGAYSNIPTVAGTASLPLDYRNTWRGSVGAIVNLTSNFALHMGTGFDQSPTIDATRTVRLPDGARLAAAIGAHYQINPTWGLDVGYQHLFVKDATLVAPTISGSQVSTTVGETKNLVDLVGAQLTVNFT